MRVSRLVAGPSLLLLQVSAPSATDAGGSTLAHIAGIADIVVTLALLVLVVVATVAARSLLKTSERVRGLIDRVEGDVVTVTRAGAEIADQGRAIASLARRNAEHLHETVNLASDGARRGVAQVEERVRGLGAALGALQDEVEGVLAGTASAIRGVREGAAAIPRGLISRLFGGRRRRRGSRRKERTAEALNGRDGGAAEARAPSARRGHSRPADPAARAPKINAGSAMSAPAH